jgi:hypothetical protein
MKPQPRMGKSIRKVTLLVPDPEGNLSPVVLFDRAREQKKVSRPLRPFEKAIRRAADAEATFAKAYLSRHRRSNSKKKDGWIRDLNVNLFKATRRGFKKSPLGRLIAR